MFVTMMFVQTPAIAGNSAVLINNASNAKSTDYQSGNQFSSGNTQSATTNLGKSNLNGISQASSVNTNVVGYNQSGTVIEMNSSYVYPKQSLSFTVNSSQINNFIYNNSFSYSVKNQYGQTIYPLSSGITLTNSLSTTSTNTPISDTWNGQTLNGQIAYSSNSSSQLYAVNVSNVLNTPKSPSIQEITWNSYGNTTSIVSYKENGASSWTNTSIDAFTSIHKISLVHLNPDMVYLYQVSGHDFFGRYVNSTVKSFTTSPTTGAPYVNSTIIYTITDNSAYISFNTTLSSNGTVYWAPTPTGVGSTFSLPTSETGLKIYHTAFLPNLSPGKIYYFEIVMSNLTIPSYYSVDNNNGVFYSFITAPLSGSFSISNYQHSFNTTSSQATITFNTNTNVTARVLYSLDPNFLISLNTSFDSLNTTHKFVINMFGATNYYIRLELSNTTLIGPTTYDFTFANQYDKNNNNNIPFSFITNRLTSQDNESSLFTIILEMPTYPAVLGNYQFQFYLSQKQYLSPYTITANKTLATSAFIVNDTLVFNPSNILVQEGTFTNATGTYPIWVTSNTLTYSPTDVVSFIGKLHYSTSTNPINNSLWTNGYIPTGFVNLYFNNQKILTGSNSLFNIHSSPLNISSSFYSGLDVNTYMIMNITIPAIDIYGNVSIELNYNIPHLTSFTLPNGGQTGDYDNAQNLSLSLNVRYRLMETATTGQHNFQLTQTNFVSSATLVPMRYENNTITYPQSTILNAIKGFTYTSFTNVSNQINLPGQNIHLNLSVTLNNQPQNIFEFSRLGYTWFWYRSTLDSSLQKGNYTVQLLWTGLDGSSRGIVAEGNSVYSSNPIEFSNWFTLGVSFTIKDLTANMTVLPGSIVTLRFKAIVPSTGIAWDQDLSISLVSTNTKCTFDTVTGEYRVTVTAPTLSKSENQQIETLHVTGSVPFANNTLTYFVSSNPVISSNTGSGKAITISDVNVHVSLIGFGYIGLALVGTAVYAASIIYFIRRK